VSPRGRPKIHTEPVVRSQVSLPISVDKELRKLGDDSLSVGISRAAYARPKKPKKVPRYVAVTDPDEIAAIQRNEHTDPNGGLFDGIWIAEPVSLKKYRKFKAEGRIEPALKEE
jgi:hypothetical protein